MTIEQLSQAAIEGIIQYGDNAQRMSWTAVNASASRAQGWGLVLMGSDKNQHEGMIVKVRNRNGGRGRRLRCRDKFETHEEARAFVDQLVDQDDPLAYKAVAILARWLLT